MIVAASAVLYSLVLHFRLRSATQDRDTYQQQASVAHAEATEARSEVLQAQAAQQLAEKKMKEEMRRFLESSLERDLTTAFPELVKLQGTQITPMIGGRAHPFVERIDVDQQIVYNNTTSSRVQPLVRVEFYNAHGIFIGSMNDEWTWSTIAPGERRVESLPIYVRDGRSFDSTGKERVYYTITIEDKESSSRGR